MIQYLMNMSFQLKFSYCDVFLFFNENSPLQDGKGKWMGIIIICDSYNGPKYIPIQRKWMVWRLKSNLIYNSTSRFVPVERWIYCKNAIDSGLRTIFISGPSAFTHSEKSRNSTYSFPHFVDPVGPIIWLDKVHRYEVNG